MRVLFLLLSLAATTRALAQNPPLSTDDKCRSHFDKATGGLGFQEKFDPVAYMLNRGKPAVLMASSSDYLNAQIYYLSDRVQDLVITQMVVAANGAVTCLVQAKPSLKTSRDDKTESFLSDEPKSSPIKSQVPGFRPIET